MARFVGVVSEIARVFADGGVDLSALGLAWARVAPTVALVPAFGLRALPAPARGVLGLGLAACVFPALVPIAAANAATPWPILALLEIVHGLPVALAAAIPLWAATMAGGLADALRGASDSVSAPTVEGRATPLGVPLSLLACAIFLWVGGPARVVETLVLREFPAHPLLAAARDITSGITLSVALGAPILAASLVLEIAGALIARAASPAQVHALYAPVRAIGLLALFGIVVDRMASVLAVAIARGTGG